MSPITAALFESADDARRAIHALRDHGVSDASISVLAGGDRVDATVVDASDDAPIGNPGDSRKAEAAGKDQGISTTTAGDAGKGAAEGAAIGASLGIAAALVSLVIPGFGLVMAGGALATAMAGAAATAAGGAVAGGVAGYFTDLGVMDQAAHHFEKGVRQGGVFVSVHDTLAVTPETIHEIFVKYNGQDADTYPGRDTSTRVVSEPDVLITTPTDGTILLV